MTTDDFRRYFHDTTLTDKEIEQQIAKDRQLVRSFIRMEKEKRNTKGLTVFYN